MLSFTDTNGKITPIRFRFADRDGELITVKIENIISYEQRARNLGVSYECTATFYGASKHFTLYYNSFSGTWVLSRISQ